MRGMFYRVGVAFDGVAGLSKTLREPESCGLVPILVHRSLGETPSRLSCRRRAGYPAFTLAHETSDRRQIEPTPVGRDAGGLTRPRYQE